MSSAKNVTKRLEVPQNMRAHGNCKNCFFWSREHVREMVMLPDGNLVPYDQLKQQAQAMLLQGQPLPIADMPRTDSAACWRFPQWQMQPGDHYCGEFTPDTLPVTSLRKPHQ